MKLAKSGTNSNLNEAKQAKQAQEYHNEQNRLKAVELGYRYSGDEEDLFDFKQNQSFVSLETYEALLAIYY